MSEWFAKVKEALSRVKREELIIVDVLIVVLLAVYFWGGGNLFSFAGGTRASDAPQSEYSYCERMTMDITDAVEDVVIQINMDQVKLIRPDSIEFSELLIRCCKRVEELLEEFRNFKKSKLIK